MKNRIRSTGRFPTPQPVIPSPPLLPTSPYPRDKIGVMGVAEAWYDQRHVALNEQAIAALPVGEIKAPPVGPTNLSAHTGSLYSSCAYGIAMNAINYRFWDKADDGRFIRYEQDGRVGAMAMTHAFQQAWNDPGSPIAQARDHHIPMKVADIVTLFGDMPDPDSRKRILNEVLLSPKLGDLADLAVAQAQDGRFDTTMAAALADAFPQAYGDGVLKKAQLAVSALWREALDAGFQPTCDLTAFADYQIPNVLRHMGLLTYSDDLAARIGAMDLIAPESPEERAIRAASILAVERLALAQGVNVADVDYWIWTKRKEPTTPFHLTMTNAY